MARRTLENLSWDECFTLLGQGTVGRLVYSDELGPAAVPVNYALAGQHIVFRSVDGSKVRANGGLLLAFDKDGKLLAENFQDVTDRDVEDIKDHLKVAIAAGAMAVQNSVNPTQSTVTTDDGVPFLQIAEANGASGPVLERSPIIWG